MKKILSLLSLALLAHCSFADVTPGQGGTLPQSEHVVWTGQPIAFSVPIGQERLINFPGAVTFKNLDTSLTADKVAITNNEGTLYIKALQAFSPIRTYVQIKSTGEVVYLDLSARASGDDMAVTVVTPSSSSTVTNPDSTPTTSAPPTYLSMLQYAVAEVYWPERLLTHLKTDPSYFSYSRSPMYTTHSVHLLAGTPILAMPEASWRNGDLFVTAVLLLNPNRQTVEINPFQNLIGAWQAASLYPTNYLSAQGTAHDRTMLFLVSSQPFNEALHQITDYRQEQ